MGQTGWPDVQGQARGSGAQGRGVESSSLQQDGSRAYRDRDQCGRAHQGCVDGDGASQSRGTACWRVNYSEKRVNRCQERSLVPRNGFNCLVKSQTSLGLAGAPLPTA